MSVDRPSRLVVAWTGGPRTAALAEAVVQTTRQRTAGHAGIAWVSDGWDAYEAAIPETYWDRVPMCRDGPSWAVLRQTPGVRLTQAVKHRRRRRLVAVEVRATIGEVAAQPASGGSTSNASTGSCVAAWPA